MYLRGSDYDDDGDFQNGNADDETVSDMVSMIWPNDGDECDCEEYDGNVEAVMAMMRVAGSKVDFLLQFLNIVLAWQ